MVRYTIDHMMSDIVLKACLAGDCVEDYTVSTYLTGGYVFRQDIAFTAPYKGNRSKEKPTYLSEARDQLTTVWDAVLEEPYEADDLVAIEATKDLDNSIIVSLDKDFYQIECRMFNFVKNEMREAPDTLQANKELYKQVLTGDSIDNIIGADGCGPVTASMLIDGCRKESDMAAIAAGS